MQDRIQLIGRKPNFLKLNCTKLNFFECAEECHKGKRQQRSPSILLLNFLQPVEPHHIVPLIGTNFCTVECISCLFYQEALLFIVTSWTISKSKRHIGFKCPKEV